jgi:proteasome lid subunit RPN8/RPN11
MQLWMTPDLSRMIAEHAKKSQPDECCGVMLGVGNHVTQVMPVPNIAENPRNNYRMDDKTVVELFCELSANSKKS